MAKNKKPRVLSKAQIVEELLRNVADEDITKLCDVLSRTLNVKKKRLEQNENEREKLSEKVQSLEFELNKQSKQNQELEQKVAKLEQTKSIF